jgi:hypothetical protein
MSVTTVPARSRLRDLLTTQDAFQFRAVYASSVGVPLLSPQPVGRSSVNR